MKRTYVREFVKGTRRNERKRQRGRRERQKQGMWEKEKGKWEGHVTMCSPGLCPPCPYEWEIMRLGAVVLDSQDGSYKY